MSREGALDPPFAPSHTRWLLLILVATLITRILFVSVVNPDPRDAGRFDDTILWHGAARLLADGHGFVHPDQLTPTGIFPPGYLVGLAALFKLPGDDVAAARALNIAASLVLVFCAYYLGSKLWDARAGLIAGGIMAFFPSGVFFSSLVLRELVFAAATAALLSLTLAWTLRDDVKPALVAVLGIIAGMVALTRPEGFFLAIAICAAWIFYHRSFSRVGAYTLLLLGGMAMLFVPWAVRNYLIFDQPVLLGTSGGSILYEAHQPDSRGNGNGQLPLELSLRFNDTALPKREAEINSEGTSEAIAFAIHNLPKELTLATHRFAGFYRGDSSHLVYFGPEVSAGSPELSASWLDRWRFITDSYYYLVLGVALAGLPFWVGRFRREHTLVVMPIVVYSVAWALLFVGHNRYHFPLLSQFAVLAGIGAAAIWDRLTHRTASREATV
jgi:hypothetical protein